MREFEIMVVYNRELDSDNDYHKVIRVVAESPIKACELVDNYSMEGIFESVEDDYIEDSLYSVSVLSSDGHPIDVDKESVRALKNFVKSMEGDTDKPERKKRLGNINLGELEFKLSGFGDEEQLVLSNDNKLSGKFGSYRGYYEDLYFDTAYNLSYDEELCSVGELKKLIRSAYSIGSMTGYKGGEFSIDKDTLIWIASYGECGDKVTDVQKIDGVVTLIIE